MYQFATDKGASHRPVLIGVASTGFDGLRVTTGGCQLLRYVTLGPPLWDRGIDGKVGLCVEKVGLRVEEVGTLSSPIGRCRVDRQTVGAVEIAFL